MLTRRKARAATGESNDSFNDDARSTTMDMESGQVSDASEFSDEPDRPSTSSKRPAKRKRRTTGPKLSREEALKKKREHMREYRARLLPGETEEDRKLRWWAIYRRWHEEEKLRYTPEERALRKAAEYEKRLLKKQMETPEQREERLAHQREWGRRNQEGKPRKKRVGGPLTEAEIERRRIARKVRAAEETAEEKEYRKEQHRLKMFKRNPEEYQRKQAAREIREAKGRYRKWYRARSREISAIQKEPAEEVEEFRVRLVAEVRRLIGLNPVVSRPIPADPSKEQVVKLQPIENPEAEGSSAPSPADSNQEPAGPSTVGDSAPENPPAPQNRYPDLPDEIAGLMERRIAVYGRPRKKKVAMDANAAPPAPQKKPSGNRCCVVKQESGGVVRYFAARPGFQFDQSVPGQIKFAVGTATKPPIPSYPPMDDAARQHAELKRRLAIWWRHKLTIETPEAREKRMKDGARYVVRFEFKAAGRDQRVWVNYKPPARMPTFVLHDPRPQKPPAMAQGNENASQEVGDQAAASQTETPADWDDGLEYVDDYP